MNRTFSDVSGKEIKTAYGIAIEFYNPNGNKNDEIWLDVTKEEQEKLKNKIKDLLRT